MPEEIFRKLLLLSASGGLMACVLLLIRALFWRKIPPRVLYALWSLPVLRLLLPFAPESRLSVFQPLVRSGAAVPDVSYAAPPASPGNLASGGGPAVASFPLPSAASSPSPIRIAAMIWLTVAAALLLYFLAANLFLRLKLNHFPRFSDARVNKVLAQCCAELRVGAPVRLAVTERPKPPAVFGVIRPVILLPRAAAEGCSENDLRYIFLHELTHIRRHDGAVRLLTLFLKAVNWFNPILWYALHKMSEDCEISCDACVLVRLSGKERRSYGDAVVGMIRAVADGRASAGAVGFADSFSKRRIFMIAKVQKISRCRAVAAVLALILAGCASLPPKPPSDPVSQNPASSASEPEADGSDSLTKYLYKMVPAESGSTEDGTQKQLYNLVPVTSDGKEISDDSQATRLAILGKNIVPNWKPGQLYQFVPVENDDEDALDGSHTIEFITVIQDNGTQTTETKSYKIVPVTNGEKGQIPEDAADQMESLRKTKSKVDVIIASMKEDQNLSDTEKAAQENALDEKRQALTEEMESLQNLISAKTSGQSAGPGNFSGIGAFRKTPEALSKADPSAFTRILSDKSS